MVINLSEKHSLVSNWLSELRDIEIQEDRLRFRSNLQKIGEVSAYRKHRPDGTFEISLDYISCPEMENRVVIISDPMLATGSSLVKTMQFIREEGNPSEIHIVCALACTVGIEYVLRAEPKASIWCGDIDDELTAKGYIVPGLGDAGDLAYGVKVQM